MGGKLPGLSRSDVNAFLDRFAPGHDRKGDLVKGTAAAGSFTIHLDHGGKLTQQQLNRALKYLGVSREQFDEWREAK